MTTIITACMNRNGNLEKALPSWLLAANEIVIVDWSSNTQVLDSINSIISKMTLYAIKMTTTSVKIIHVTNAKKWILTSAFNLALNYASYSNILKLDCDDILKPDFMSNHPIIDGCFYCGNWQNARTPQETYLNGILMCNKNDIMSVNCYNEYISTYGWDDSDLYDRLTATLTKKYINNDCVTHLYHEHKDMFNEIQYNRLLCKYLHAKDAPKSIFTVTEKSQQDMITKIVGTITINATIPYEIHCKIIDDLHSLLRVKNPNVYNALTLRVLNGLGNKLRALASGISFVNWLRYNCKNRFYWKLNVVWPIDEHCQALHTDLFTLQSLQNNQCDMVVFTNDDNTNNAITMTTNMVSTQTSTLANVNDILFKESTNDIYIQTASIIDYPGSNWDTDCKYLRSLVPVDNIQKQLDELLLRINIAGYDISLLTGIHIRSGQDNKPDDVSLWDKDKQLQWNKWRDQSQYNKFKEIIDKKIQENPNSGFYLASDSEKVYTTATSEYKNIFIQQRTIYDRSKDQVITGLIDVLMLAKTSSFYGSNWSSFSELVARLGSKNNHYAGKDW